MQKIDKTIDRNILEIIEGLLLGDGAIYHTGNDYYSLRLSGIQYDYLKYTQEVLIQLNVPSKLYHYHTTSSGNLAYRLETTTWPNLALIHREWYPVRKKSKVPITLSLSPLSALHWYIGDGTMDKKRSRIQLCTNCFDYESQLVLQEKLFSLSINSNIKRTEQGSGSFSLTLSCENVPKFLAYIGECPVPSYDYKWNIGTKKKNGESNYRIEDYIIYQQINWEDYWEF